jgi:hypothetical protein
MISKRSISIVSIFILTWSVLVLAPVSLSQQTLGGITATVMDSSSGALAGTTVTLVSDSIKLTRTQKTGDAGSYDFVNLPIGAYTLTFSHDGFQSQKPQLGRVNAACWTTIYKQLLDFKVIDKSFDPATAYTLRFVESK